MKSKNILCSVFVGYVLCLSASCQAQVEAPSDSDPMTEASPVVLGYGVGLFKVGAMQAQDDFENLDNWVVQIQENNAFEPPHVLARNNSLDCRLPGRGCTVWFKQKLKTRLTITYDVICPTPKPAVKGLQARDINNFWLATDPLDLDQGLFDASRYTGEFGSYGKMQGYYASTGGGGSTGNQTTRMRRYPREVDGKPVAHIALNYRDGQPGYLITPDKVMTVQLVAYDDVVQYIVDGKIIYEIKQGDSIDVESGHSREKAIYDLDRFPVYREGYFGFRMVGTHHIYTNFKVYVLEPDNSDQPAAGR
ncbi:DUF6250 domain-containing protein [Planctomycetota bacterium]